MCPELRLLHNLLAEDGLHDWELGEGLAEAVDALAEVEAAVHVDQGVSLVRIHLHLFLTGTRLGDYVLGLMVGNEFVFLPPEFLVGGQYWSETGVLEEVPPERIS